MRVHSWLVPSYRRVFPHTRPPAEAGHLLSCHIALNEQCSFQVAVCSEESDPETVRIDIEVPTGWAARVRRVGLVPVQHRNTPVDVGPEDVEGAEYIPGYVPDPLFDEETFLLPPAETHAFWITVRPGFSAVPGEYMLRVSVIPARGEAAVHLVRVTVYPVELLARRGFHITHWFYADALIDWYRTNLFDARFWNLLRTYVQDVVSHGQDTLYVPVFTPPLDGVKRPTQLLVVRKRGPDQYEFDWRDVKRYVEIAEACGISYFEWCHLFTQWGARDAIRVYAGQGENEELLWPPETSATSPTYRQFLSQFLPALHRFLSEEGLLERSFFHLSDEPHGEDHLRRYREARTMVRELAPWMRVMDALTDITFAREGLVDIPIPSILTALDFVREGIPSWCYYCCVPRGPYLNRLLDTPLAKIAMHGLLFYRWPFQGFLHWGYNYWYRSQTRELIDPYTVQDGANWEHGWAYGDPFEVYPGPAGPVDSIRWEVFAESLQDYQLLQTLGVSRDDPRLMPLQDFAHFPKQPNWRLELRAALLKEVR